MKTKELQWRCPKDVDNEYAELYRERVVGDSIDMNVVAENTSDVAMRDLVETSEWYTGNDWMCNQCDLDFKTPNIINALIKAQEHFTQVYVKKAE